MYASGTPFDVAVSLIAHSAVPPVRAEQARRAAAWLLGGPPARHTPAQHTADLAVKWCRALPAPVSLRAAADLLAGVTLADAARVSAQLRDRGLTQELVPMHGLLRVLQVWQITVDGLQLRDVGGRAVVIGAAGRAWLAELTAAVRTSRGPVRLPAALTADPELPQLAADFLGVGLTDGWINPISSAPPTSGLGYLALRLLRVNPQTVADIAAAANSHHVLDRGVQRPPPHILRNWLTAQPWCDVGGDGLIRLTKGVQPRPHRLDDTLAAAIRTHPDRPTAHTELNAAILGAGYAPSGASSLIGASPIPERVSARRNSGYRLRGAQPTATPGSGTELRRRTARLPRGMAGDTEAADGRP